MYRTSQVQYWCPLLAANGITLFSLAGPFGFFETIEVAMGGEYPPAGSGTEVYPYLRQCGVDTVFAEIGVL
jgi:hypothetical protein